LKGLHRFVGESDQAHFGACLAHSLRQLGQLDIFDFLQSFAWSPADAARTPRRPQAVGLLTRAGTKPLLGESRWGPGRRFGLEARSSPMASPSYYPSHLGQNEFSGSQEG
jgi:hypothetical protein